MSVSVVLSFVAAFCLDFCFAASEGKVSKSAPEAKAKMIDWASLEVVDYLRSGALIAAFIGLIVADNKQRASRSGRKTNYFVNAEIIAWFVGGLAMFFFPANLLGYMTTKKLTPFHLAQFQNVAAVAIGGGLAIAKIKSHIENDGLVYSAWLMSRTVGYGGLLLINTQAYFSSDVFSTQHLTLQILKEVVFFAACLYQLWRGANVGGSGSTTTALTSGVNRYIILDIVLSLPPCILLLANPAQTFGMFTDQVSFDALNVNLAQTLAASSITCYMFYLCVLHCDNDEVKKSLFLARIVIVGFNIPCICLNHWKTPNVSNNAFFVILMLQLVQAGYCYMGYTYEDGARQKSR